MLAALAASSTADCGPPRLALALALAGWDSHDQHSKGLKQTFLIAGLAGLQGPLTSPMFTGLAAQASAASRPPSASLGFYLSFFALGHAGGPQCVSLIWRRDWWEVHWSK
jgi:hypothetical protein